MSKKIEPVLSKIEQTLEKIDGRIDNIDKTQAVHNQQLSYHIKRTNILEKQVNDLNKHKTKIDLIIKMVGWLVTGSATLLGSIEGIKFLISYLSK